MILFLENLFFLCGFFHTLFVTLTFFAISDVQFNYDTYIV